MKVGLETILSKSFRVIVTMGMILGFRLIVQIVSTCFVFKNEGKIYNKFVWLHIWVLRSLKISAQSMESIYGSIVVKEVTCVSLLRGDRS